MAKRRTPPLFEVLSAPDRRPGPGVGGGVLSRPIKVDLPHPAVGTNGSHASLPAPDGARRRLITYWCIGAAVLMGGFIVVYMLAFRMGREDKAQEIAPWLHEAGQTPGSAGGPSSPGSPLNSPSTVPPVAGGGGIGLQPGADPSVTAPEASAPDPTTPLADPRKPGNNYLHLAQLNWKDAERAVAYLNQHGVPAAAVPAKAVDPQEARAKNQPHLVFALEAIPSEQFKTSERKRQDLVEKVRRIGKKWQTEEKGPSDFGEPNWARFK